MLHGILLVAPFSCSAFCLADIPFVRRLCIWLFAGGYALARYLVPLF